MNQQTSDIWQHSPSEIQVKSNPVKEVEKTKLSSSQTSLPTISWEDMMGLSWTLSKGDYDYEEEYR